MSKLIRHLRERAVIKRVADIIGRANSGDDISIAEFDFLDKMLQGGSGSFYEKVEIELANSGHFSNKALKELKEQLEGESQ